MIDWRKTVIAAVVVLAATAGVYADLTPTSPVQGGEYEQASLQPDDLSNSLLGPSIVDLSMLPGAFLPATATDVTEASQAQPPVELIGSGQGSLDLCLYALAGLGLCRSGRWVKKISLGFVPEWYHDGGPYQVGHSHAIEPNLCSSPAVCFVQPDHVANDSLPHSLTGTMASLWRRSEFTLAALATRGPPHLMTKFVGA